MNRLKDGYVLVPNPHNAIRLGRVELSPANVDCIVFWTKNPIPLSNKFAVLDKMGYAYYIQFTLTPYDKMVESCLPPKDVLINAFVEISKRIGKERIVWRYDPVFIDEKHPTDWHIDQFTKMCTLLHSYTERCTLSFIDPYKNIRNSFRSMTHNEMLDTAAGLSEIAGQCGVLLYTCSEEIDLSSYGIRHSSCIDKSLVERIIGFPINIKKDTNQRPSCCCIESVDIGVYDTCPHGCSYCYATPNVNTMLRRVTTHNPSAPMLTGYPVGNEIITNRTTLKKHRDVFQNSGHDTNDSAC